METRHPVEPSLRDELVTLEAPAPGAPADPLAVPATLGTRRDFCRAACVASLGALAAATLQACGGGSNNPNDPNGNFTGFPVLPSINATVANGAATFTIDASSPLATPGNAALVTSGIGSMLVVRNDATTVTAFTAICTHQQCTVNTFQGGTFQCPCHGSQYNTSGAVTRGPAPSSLRRFNATLNNNVVTITV
jgi:cytochrome b6-f complex iron-sulfur subunit